MSDVRDILELEGAPQTVTSKNAIIHGNKQVCIILYNESSRVMVLCIVCVLLCYTNPLEFCVFPFSCIVVLLLSM